MHIFLSVLDLQTYTTVAVLVSYNRALQRLSVWNNNEPSVDFYAKTCLQEILLKHSPTLDLATNYDHAQNVFVI